MTEQAETQPQQHQFTEAPASWNIRYRVNGFDEQLTLRGGSFAAIKDQVDKAREYVKTHFAPNAHAVADAVNTEPPAPTVAATAPAAPAAPATAAAVIAPNPGTLTFPAETLVANITDGKTYWRVKGGPFKRHGVTVWGEVLEAAGLGRPDPMQQWNVSGWTAHYVLNENGKLHKVTKLSKAE